nr:hypothetical protein CFP56_66534 [Quercus suber]
MATALVFGCCHSCDRVPGKRHFDIAIAIFLPTSQQKRLHSFTRRSQTLILNARLPTLFGICLKSSRAITTSLTVATLHPFELLLEISPLLDLPDFLFVLRLSK